MRRQITRSAVGLALAGLFELAFAVPSYAGVLPDAGVDYGPPLQWSAYGDLWLRGGFAKPRPLTPCIGGQLGFDGGGGLSIGVGRSPSLQDVPIYWRLRISTTFTGDSPLHAPPKSTYAGLHGDVGVWGAVRLRVGVETRLGGDRDDTRLTWGVGASPILPVYLFIAAHAVADSLVRR